MFYLDVLKKEVKKINISVTDRCNFKCNICNIWKRNPRRELSLSFYEQFFNKHNWHWVSLTGGEPFLRDDIYDIAKSALKYCTNLNTISIVTNGYFTNQITDFTSKILRDNLRYAGARVFISISLDGLEEFHDYQRGVNSSFKRAIATFHTLKKFDDRRLNVHLLYTISKLSQGNLMKTIYQLGLTPNDFVLAVANKGDFYGNASCDVEPDKDVLKKDLKGFLENFKVRSIPNIAQRIFIRYLLEGKRIPCVGGINSFFLDVDGTVYPCIAWPRNSSNIGSLNEINSLSSPCMRRCYTPCESYLSLLLNWKESLWKI